MITYNAYSEAMPELDTTATTAWIARVAEKHGKRIGNVNGYKIAKEGGDWVAYKSCDTTLIKPADLKEKESRPLVVFNLSTGDYKVTNYVKDYLFSEDGSVL